MNTSIASPIKDGFTWTIASKVGHALFEAERQFGPRDPSYFYAGHEFVRSNPAIWYPGNRRHVVIQLGLECMDDQILATYQLSHEVIHLLSPTGGQNGTNLEEGLAVWFSKRFTAKETGKVISAGLPCYEAAEKTVAKMLLANPLCVVEMRKIQPCISKISSQLIAEHSPDLSSSECSFLAAKFLRTR